MYLLPEIKTEAKLTNNINRIGHMTPTRKQTYKGESTIDERCIELNGIYHFLKLY